MNIRIIVAEDNDVLLEDLCQELNGQPDFQVVATTSSGVGAVEAALAMEFDVILLDIEMETIQAGIDAAAAIHPQKPEAKIIYLTAHDTDRMILTAMATGAVDYIVKGCSDEELLTHIRAAAAGHPMLDAKIQNMVFKEYSRLRASEKSLLFFINSVSKLTSAERALVRLLLDGKKVREIAEIRCVEVVTVKTQIKGLLRKFGCARTKDIVELIRELNVAHLF